MDSIARNMLGSEDESGINPSKRTSIRNDWKKRMAVSSTETE
jgi:hypothetical protein